MSDQAVRQRYRLGTGGGEQSAPAKTANPGFKRGGMAKKQAGGQVYRKGGKSSKSC